MNFAFVCYLCISVLNMCCSGDIVLIIINLLLSGAYIY